MERIATEKLLKKAEKRLRNGLITVEATLILPIYILAILFIINFLNISYFT